MTKGWYVSARDGVCRGDIRPLTDTIRIYAVNTALYTVNLGTHQFLSAVSPSALVGFDTLAAKTSVSGVFDAADCNISNPINTSIEALLAVKWTGSTATSPLLWFDDTITPSSSDPVNVAWDSGASKIWRLTG